MTGRTGDCSNSRVGDLLPRKLSEVLKGSPLADKTTIRQRLGCVTPLNRPLSPNSAWASFRPFTAIGVKVWNGPNRSMRRGSARGAESGWLGRGITDAAIGYNRRSP
jgi:hypothetical protein